MAGALEKGGQRCHIVGSEDRIHPRHIVEDGVLILLCKATAHGDLHARMVLLRLLQCAQRAVEALVGIFADSARVKDDEIRLRGLVCGRVASFLQQTGNALGIVHIHLAAEGSDFIGTGFRNCLLHVGIV